MQMSEARQLRKEWGDKPCDHPQLEKEYYLGSRTGEFVCNTCGEEFTSERKEALEKSRARPEKDE